MPLSLHDIEFLRSDKGRDVLQSYAGSDLSDANTLSLLTRLRKSLSPRRAAAVLTTLELRQRAASKFPLYSQKMLFTRESLQQASHPQIRKYRAGLFQSQSILDVCCSIGSDSFAIAQGGRHVLGLDMDPVRIAIAKHNRDVIGVAADFATADVTNGLPQGYGGIFYDPSRRDEQGRRIHDVERYLPPLSLSKRWQTLEIAVKLSPAVQQQLASYGGQLEFISVAGNLTEALLWKHRPAQRPLATRIDAAGMHQFAYDNSADVAATPPKSWLFEPDPTIIRSGALRHLAARMDANLLDETIAYLTLDNRVATPWGRFWRILDWMPYNLKKLRQYLKAHNVGHITVKKRGFPMSPEELIAKLRLKGGNGARVLVMTRCRRRPIAIICEQGSGECDECADSS